MEKAQEIMPGKKENRTDERFLAYRTTTSLIGIFPMGIYYFYEKENVYTKHQSNE